MDLSPKPIYRVRFETVSISELHKYCNADPRFYKNVTQLVPNSQIPDEDWHEVLGHETDNPWDQFNNLMTWVLADREFVRKVTVELQPDPTWRPLSAEELEEAAKLAGKPALNPPILQDPQL
jgi:hypothetical protein